MSLENWEDCIKILKKNLSQHEYRRWIDPLDFSSNNLGKSVLTAPNNHFIELLKGKVFWEKVIVDYFDKNNACIPEVTSKVGELKEGNFLRPTPNVKSKFPIKQVVNKLQKQNPANKNRRNIQTKVYTFENFIEGKGNSIAYNIAQSLVDNSEENNPYNPLFIYGESGVGKTHLLHAIKHSFEEKSNGSKVYYQQAADFVSGLVMSLRTGKMEEFKEQYQSQDIVLIDDVEFFVGKSSTMEEFFQLMNHFIEGRKPIVLTSDKMPNEIGMSDRIRSRLGSGVSLQIEMPNFEHRVMIITENAKKLKLNLTEDVAYWIARKAEVSVRELIGLVTILKAHIQHGSATKITMYEVERLLLPSLSTFKSVVSPEKVIKETTSYYSLRANELTSKARRKPVVHARNMAMNIIKDKTSLSLAEIGSHFSRDHSTVIHAINKAIKKREANLLIEQDYQNIIKKLNK